MRGRDFQLNGAVMDKNGINLWRQVSEALADEIVSGALPAGERLPASTTLATRFGVHRHTVLKAISHLQSEGLLRVEQGRGTYVVENPVKFRLGPQTWFEQNLLDSSYLPSRTVLSVDEMPAPHDVGRALGLSAGDEVVLVNLVGEADGFPVYFGNHYFPSGRLPGVGRIFRDFGHGPTDKVVFSDILGSLGYPDFRRKSIRIRSRPPSSDEARHLQMASSTAVLETETTLVDPDDVPVAHAFVRYSSDRVELIMEL